MSLLVISHTYISEENQKNIVALRRHLNVRVAVPDSFKSTVFKTIRPRVGGNGSNSVRIFKAIHLPRSQFILRPFKLDLDAEPTDVINVEYDPWSVMFWQAMVARNRARPGCKLVCTIKNNTYTRYRGPLGLAKRAVARKGIAAVDLFLASSQKVAELYQEQFGVSAERIAQCFHLGVDTALFTPRPAAEYSPEQLAIGYCGRFDPDKGVLELVDAVRSSRKSNGLELQLHLLGRGSLQETLARAQDEEPWIRLFEPVPHHEVPRFLQNLDMFVLPSRVSPDREEHDAHALVEAMAVGLPCIGTRSGIIPQLLAGGAGFLVPANSTQELAQALATLATDPGKRASLGRKARETALANHALDSLAANKAAIFKRLGCT